MHLTYRPSGYRFQIRVPRDLEGVFGSSPIRLNLGPVGRRTDFALLVYSLVTLKPYSSPPEERERKWLLARIWLRAFNVC